MCMRNTSLGISLALDSARDQSMVNVDCKLHHNHRVFLLRCAVTDISKRDLGSKGGSRTVSSCRLRSKGRTLTFRSCHVYIRQGCCVLDSIRACTLVCGTSTYVVLNFNHITFSCYDENVTCTTHLYYEKITTTPTLEHRYGRYDVRSWSTESYGNL